MPRRATTASPCRTGPRPMKGGTQWAWACTGNEPGRYAWPDGPAPAGTGAPELSKKLFGQHGPIGSADRQVVVIEVVAGVMHLAAPGHAVFAIADEQIAAGALFEHEGEVFAGGQRVALRLDIVGADQLA